MKAIRSSCLLLHTLLSWLALSGLFAVVPIAAADGIVVDGSSTVYPLTLEAAHRYERAQRDAQIEVRFSGSNAGFRRFCAGELDIGNASRLMNAEEAVLCKAAEVRYRKIPVAMDSIAIVVHPDNTWVRDISIAELRALWEPAAEGQVKTWQDVRAQWPARPVVLFGRGQDSGTYDYFTTEVVGVTRSSRSDYTASEDEEALAAAIAKEPNALGFFGIGAYHRHWDELKLVAVDNGSGPVYPTLETVKQGLYRPLTRPLFLTSTSRASPPNLVSGASLRPMSAALPAGSISPALCRCRRANIRTRSSRSRRPEPYRRPQSCLAKNVRRRSPAMTN